MPNTYITNRLLFDKGVSFTANGEEFDCRFCRVYWEGPYNADLHTEIAKHLRQLHHVFLIGGYDPDA